MKTLHRGWRLWVLLAFLATGGLLLVAQDQETVRVQSAVTARAEGFAQYVSALTGDVKVHRGDTFTVLRNGVEAIPAMLDAIRQAKSRINLETYIYEDGEVADQVTQALADAARRGVTVRLVLDSHGATLSEESQKTLTDAGATIAWFNTVRPWNIEEANYRTHRKLLVVDATIGFTGGMGFADHWLGNADAKERWRDTQIRIVGPSVRAIEASFYENWLESGGEAVPALEPELPPLGTGAQSLVIWSNPTSGVSNVKLLYLLSIAGATRTLDIQSPYVVLDESTRWALDAARRRGVRVRILTEGEVTDAKPVKLASREGYGHLLATGVEIFEYQPTMMHAKAMIVDGIWSVAGSANFDNRSLELNDELCVAVADSGLAEALTRDFNADTARAKQLTLDEWKKRGLLEKSREKFWSLFGEIF